MWPLTNGLQCLGGDEAGLFRGAVGMMVDQLVLELNEGRDEEASEEERHEPQGPHEPQECQEHDQPFSPKGYSSELPNPFDEPVGELPSWLADFNDEAPGENAVDSGYDDQEDDSSAEGFGFETPHLYSMWEPEQRIWLLERVAVPLLTARRAPPAAAVFEATVEAVYVELADLIAMEITSGTPIEKGSWRGSLLDAYVQRCPKDSLLSALQFEATTLDPCLPPAIKKQLRTIDDGNELTNESPESLDWLHWWTMVIERLVDATYGPRLYHDAEAFLDGDPRELQRYLRTKGLNAKFMRRIPPLRTHEQTQKTIDRLQGILFQE